MTICVTLCSNTAELQCGLKYNVVLLAVDAVHMADIKVELKLCCSCRSLSLGIITEGRSSTLNNTVPLIPYKNITVTRFN